MFVSLFERQGVDIQIGFVGTRLPRAQRTVRGDMRAALVWFRPAAILRGHRRFDGVGRARGRVR